MAVDRAMGWWCGGVMLFGLVLAAGAFGPTAAVADGLLAWFGGGPVTPSTPLRFAVGLMGAVTIGWGASLLAVATVSTTLADDQRINLWRRVGWAMIGWYLIDSTISIATGFWPNAVSNTVVAALFFAVQRRF